MPAVLIEVGFLTHPKEVKQLARPEYQDQIAEKISNAILTFKEKMDKPELRTLN
jgi:N-acetylmuramoyl-L-alanine amidase